MIKPHIKRKSTTSTVKQGFFIWRLWVEFRGPIHMNGESYIFLFLNV